RRGAHGWRAATRPVVPRAADRQLPRPWGALQGMEQGLPPEVPSKIGQSGGRTLLRRVVAIGQLALPESALPMRQAGIQAGRDTRFGQRSPSPRSRRLTPGLLAPPASLPGLESLPHRDTTALLRRRRALFRSRCHNASYREARYRADDLRHSIGGGFSGARRAP